MQYLMAIAWVVFIAHELRRAHAEQCVAKRLQQLWDCLARIEVGMSTKQVQAVLGDPARVLAASDSLTWQYRIAREFKNVIFADGKVVECDPPPPQMAGELKGQDPSRVLTRCRVAAIAERGNPSLRVPLFHSRRGA